VTHALLTGEPGPVRDVVLLNAAAAAVTAAEAEPSTERLAEALRRGAEAIDSGAAAAVLQRWRHAARTRQVSRPGRR
jgi:anthranilate phosphoribosyltransferase